MAAIEIEGLRKSYGRLEVVRGLSLRVEQGSVYGLVGPNGSGKTTTLSCVLGLMRPTSGSVRVLGETPGRLHRLGGRLAVVFDTAIAAPQLSVRQNLRYLARLNRGRELRDEDELLSLVGLTKLASARASSLSLGQRKRLAIAGALLARPELLVLDEPLSGLDTLGVRQCLRLFRSLADEGVTLLLSSHRLHEMQEIVTHAGVLLGGELRVNGPLDEVLGRARGRYRVEAQPLDRAREIAERTEGVDVLPTDARQELRLHVDGDAAARLSRALVEGGCELSVLAREEESLQTVFEGLVDEHFAAEARA
ncbi:MAG: ABC transporter ATP-binding protein [Planctomycetes bacterium]|nr:ABC transporter ATP-binding protein [Planctomycetota bacterium]MCB9904661.1 ABC transporter ATP-binding protein [Planctomycetota bacterium]